MTAPFLPPNIAPAIDPHSFTVGDAKWEKHRARAVSDLYWFADVVLGLGELIPMRPKTHLLLCRFLERKTGSKLLDTARYQKIEMPRETGKCGRASDRVLVRSGHYKRHDELVVGDEVLSLDDEWNPSWQRVCAVQWQHPRPVYQVRTVTGRIVTTTGNHPYRMMSEWKNAERLRVGDRIAIVRSVPEIVAHSPVSVPEALFWGYMTGDGACTNQRFTNADAAVLADFCASVTAIGGSYIVRSTKSKATDIRVRGLRPSLRRAGLFGKTSHHKRVPSEVWSAPQSAMAAFLRAAYSCDGSVEHTSVNYSSVSEGLIRDFQHLLLRFGIVATIKRKRGRYKGQLHLSWLLAIGGRRNLLRFAEHIGFVGNRVPRLADLTSRPQGPSSGKGDTVPTEWRELIPRALRGQRNADSLRLAHNIRIDNTYATRAEKVEQVAVALGRPDMLKMLDAVYWDTVAEVRQLAPEPTIAVEVEGTHTYCIEDVVTHNSSLLRARVIQRICRDPNHCALLVNEKELLVKDFLASIKYTFEGNELLRALFPELVPKDFNDTTWSATRIIVNRQTGRPDPTIDVAGVGAALAGKHPDSIDCDDIISREAMENARAGSWQIMHQTNRWVNQLDPIVNKSADPFPSISFVGTRWWHNDSYEYIEQAFGYGEDPIPVVLRAPMPDGTTQQLTCYRVGDLAVFRRSAIEDGQSIFPEKWSLEDLAKIRLRDPALFASNYQNQPSDEVTATFKDAWLKPITWLDDHQFTYLDETAKKQTVRLQDLDLLCLVDPGGFGQRLVESRARAAAIIVGDDGKGHKFFIDCYSEQDTYLAAIRHVVAWALRYRPRKIYVERAGQQAAFAQLLREELKKAQSPVVVDDETIKPESKAKEVRILEMEPYWQRGQVYVGTGPAFHEFRTQYSQFPRAQRLDVLDILGYWPRLMKKTSHAQQTPAVRQAQEKEAYRQRLGTWRRFR